MEGNEAMKLKTMIPEHEMMDESLSMPVTAIAGPLLPKSLITRIKSKEDKEELMRILDDLKDTLNDFYKDHGINWKLR